MSVPVVAVTVLGSLSRFVDDGGFRRENHPGHRCGVEHRRAGHLDRIDDALGSEIAVAESRGVEAVSRRQFGDLVGDHGAVQTRVRGDPEQRSADNAAEKTSTPSASSPETESRNDFGAARACTRALPPPATIPSSTAALAAATASSTRCLRSLRAVSVAAPL